MRDAKAACLRLLAAHGQLLRHNRHQVYRFFDRNITITNTRTDFRGWRNKLCELRRIQREACMQECK